MPKTEKLDTVKVKEVKVGSLTVDVLDVTKVLTLRQSWLNGKVTIDGKEVALDLDIAIGSGSMIVSVGEKKYMIKAWDVMQAVCHIHSTAEGK